MKKLKLMAILMAAGLALSFGNSANAEVGFINYQKVLDNYPAAQQAVKDLDAKGLELQQYMLEKEKQYKSLDTPLKKQNFETQTATEFNAKQDALMKLRNDKENQCRISGCGNYQFICGQLCHAACAESRPV